MTPQKIPQGPLARLQDPILERDVSHVVPNHRFAVGCDPNNERPHFLVRQDNGCFVNKEIDISWLAQKMVPSRRLRIDLTKNMGISQTLAISRVSSSKP